jgi:NTE family protein
VVAEQGVRPGEDRSWFAPPGRSEGGGNKTLNEDRPALVLSGGNALGAYHLGAWRALGAAGLEPGWIAGTSIGAVTAAIIAGNPPERRTVALEQFWSRAATFDGGAALLPATMRAPFQYLQAAASRLLGRASLFTLRAPDLSGQRPGLFDATPMRGLLNELVDFDRLNGGGIRVSILAVDLETGDEVAFDTQRERLSVDHIMASAAFIPDFPAVEIDGRMLVDGGLAANLPLHLVLGDPATGSVPPPACFAVDLFPSQAPLPRSILQGLQRQTDLLFASQSKRTIAHLHDAWGGRAGGCRVFYVGYQALAEEVALKGFDFSHSSLRRRAQQGEDAMARQIEVWRTCPQAAGLQRYRFNSALAALANPRS